MNNHVTFSERKSPLPRQALVLVFLIIAITVAAAQKAISTKGLPSLDRPLAQSPVLPDGQDVINLTTDLVSVAVSVTDRGGRPIAGLQRESFKIYDDKVEQPISFFSEEDTPASVGILFDTSGSMSGDTIERAKQALARFIQTSHPQDEFFLIGFNSSPHLLLERARDGNAVLAHFTHVQPAGNTALYDAVDMGVDEVSQGVYPKHAIVLISDGEENNSRCSFGKLRRKLQESGVVVYTVKIGGPPLPNSIGRMVMDQSIGRMVMDQIAAISGGKAFWPANSERMDDALEQIALDLRRQYSIAYRPSNFVADGKLHRVKVTLAIPRELSRELIVRNRQGYYAVRKIKAR